jgi:hypothetical protein
MIEKMSESEGKILGFKVTGDVAEEDYKKVMIPEIQAIIDKEGSISLLLDLREFKQQSVAAWWADLNVGFTYHKKIDKMAMVGDKTWEKWISKLADPFYAKKAKYFHPDDIDAAWKWLKE